MRSKVLVPLVVLVVLTSVWAMSSAVEGAAGGRLVAGASFQDSDTELYAYGELNVVPSLSLGLEYIDKYLAFSAWYGEWKGLYGEVAWNTDDSDAPKTWEAGVWAGTHLTETIEIYGWVGYRSEWDNGSDSWVAVGAEANIPVYDPFFVNIGVRSTLGDDSVTRGVVGIGVRF